LKALNFLLLKCHDKESKLRDNLVTYLNKYFITEIEVKSINNKGRLDLVLLHKSDIERKYPLGIEIKKINRKKGKNIGDWIKQIERYQNYDFNHYGKVLTFIFPQLSDLYFTEGILMHKHHAFRHDIYGAQHNISTFLGQLGIGELQFYDDKQYKIQARLVFCGSIIWNSLRNELNVKKADFYFPERN